MTGSSPQCLPVDTVIAINKQQTRGRGCLLEYGGLDAALCAPFQEFFGHRRCSSIYEEAAVVLFELATRHPFSDGNKRTAWVVAAVHLNRRGVTVVAEQSEVVELVVDVVCHRISSSDLTLWFVNHSSRL